MRADFFRLCVRPRRLGGLLACLYLTSSPGYAQNSTPPNSNVKVTAADSLREFGNKTVVMTQAEKIQRSSRLDIDYFAGTTAMNRNYWAHAILAFEGILAEDGNFRDARKKLAIAERNLKRKSAESILSSYYTEAALAMNRNDLGWARRALEKVNQLNPNYRDVPALLAEIEEMLQPKEGTAMPEQPLFVDTALLDSLYREGMSASEKSDWIHAVISFEKLQLLQPNYGNVTSPLAHAWEKLNQAKLAEANAGFIQINKKSLWAGAALAGFFILSTFGVIGFHPTTRARLHFWRGNNKAAAQIYEKLLRRDPQRVKLYPLLADIYLRLGRNDEQALKIFKTILNLNLATRRREEINAILAQKYLTEGRMDTDAIEVLENALKAELHKQNRLLTQGHSRERL